jgi:hypothetical protein
MCSFHVSVLFPRSMKCVGLRSPVIFHVNEKGILYFLCICFFLLNLAEKWQVWSGMRMLETSVYCTFFGPKFDQPALWKLLVIIHWFSQNGTGSSLEVRWCSGRQGPTHGLKELNQWCQHWKYIEWTMTSACYFIILNVNVKVQQLKSLPINALDSTWIGSVVNFILLYFFWVD